LLPSLQACRCITEQPSRNALLYLSYLLERSLGACELGPILIDGGLMCSLQRLAVSLVEPDLLADFMQRTRAGHHAGVGVSAAATEH
jgi:hypothetical protein